MSVVFKNIDTIFAQKVLKGIGSNEQHTIALSYLFASSRQGHHCVSIKGEHLYPDPKNVLDEEISSTDIIKGLNSLPKEVVQEGRDHLDLRPIVKDGANYYLQKYYFLENKIATYIEQLLQAQAKMLFLQEEIDKELAAYRSHLNEEQHDAIVKSLTHSLYALTGGPGTGKTYTILYALMVYRNLCKKREHCPRILVAAPTGKAMTHLKEKLLGRQELEGCAITVSTLHSALKIKRREDLYTARPALLYDLIVLDECSMIDLNIWRVLLSAIEEGSQVILMGDPCQLPPVEAGGVFEELTQIIPRSHLNVCMRTEQKALLDFAAAIKDQNKKVLEQILSACSSVRYIEYERELEFSLLNIDSYLERFFSGDISRKRCCFLSPILQGPWGVETLNDHIYKMFLAQAQEVITLPIIITQTHYYQELYNGDTGYLVRHLKQDIQDYAIFTSGKKIEAALLPRYQYAYALSVHKSQGSEYDEVLLFLPEGAEHFGKEVLYTAVTRAKKSVTIFAKKGILQKCLEMDSKKNCAIAAHIRLNGNQE